MAAARDWMIFFAIWWALTGVMLFPERLGRQLGKVSAGYHLELNGRQP